MQCSYSKITGSKENPETKSTHNNMSEHPNSGVGIHSHCYECSQQILFKFHYVEFQNRKIHPGVRSLEVRNRMGGWGASRVLIMLFLALGTGDTCVWFVTITEPSSRLCTNSCTFPSSNLTKIFKNANMWSYSCTKIFLKIKLGWNKSKTQNLHTEFQF